MSNISIDGVDEIELKIDGCPDGTVAVGLASLAAELQRLTIFLMDMNRVQEWMKAIDNSSESVSDALSIASLIVFCTCFEGTGGIRQKPLKKRSVFSVADRVHVSDLVMIRNKLVAHDDGLYPMHMTLAIMNSDARAVDLKTLAGKLSFRNMKEFNELRRLVPICRQWLSEAHIREHNRLLLVINEWSDAERQRAVATAQPIKIKICRKDIPTAVADLSEETKQALQTASFNSPAR